MIGWSAHQVHHSSQDFNLTIGIRQSLFQKIFSAPFYIPLALFGIPPSLFLTHVGISAVHQLWIHTELIEGVHPLYDYFFNVPKHHQLHHGTNKYCIDRNYGGVLIIWDRIYGTFTEKKEHEDEPIAYGLVYGSETYEFSYLQLRYYKFLLEEIRKEETLKEMMMRIYIYVVKGPSYNPKKPKFRTGDKTDYPAGYPKYGLYDPKITLKNIVSGFFLVSKAYFVTDFYLFSDERKNPWIFCAALFYCALTTICVCGLSSGQKSSLRNFHQTLGIVVFLSLSLISTSSKLVFACYAFSFTHLILQ